MRGRIISKAVGNRMTTFTVPGGLIACVTASHADQNYMLRVLHDGRYGTYWFELRHYCPKRMIESIADRDGCRDKAILIDRVRGAALAAEDDPDIKRIADQMRLDVIKQVEAFDQPPTEIELLRQMFIRSSAFDLALESPA